MKWNIQYATSLGQAALTQVEADNREEALRLSRIPPSKIVKVTQESGWRELLDPPPPKTTQIMFLASLSSGVAGGKSVDKEFLSLCEGQKAFAPKLPALKAKTLCSQRLRLLKFDSLAAVLAETGERAGTVGASLGLAARMLSDNYRLEKQMGKGIRPQLILMGIMAILLCAVPYLFNDIFAELRLPGLGVRITLTPTTHLIFALKAFLDMFWWLVVGILVTLYVLRSKLWKVTRNWPVLRTKNQLNKTQRAVKFLSTYTTLDGAGVSATEMLTRLRDGSKGEDRDVYAHLLGEVQRGRSLSEAFIPAHFPDLMIRCLYGMESLDKAKKADTFSTLQTNLLTQVDILQDSVVNTFKTVAMLVMFTVLIIVLTGIYFPLMTISQG